MNREGENSVLQCPRVHSRVRAGFLKVCEQIKIPTCQVSPGEIIRGRAKRESVRDPEMGWWRRRLRWSATICGPIKVKRRWEDNYSARMHYRLPSRIFQRANFTCPRNIDATSFVSCASFSYFGTLGVQKYNTKIPGPINKLVAEVLSSRILVGNGHGTVEEEWKGCYKWNYS